MNALNRRGTAAAGARLLLLGLAYKGNSGDCRESPAVRVAELLHGLGAEVERADGVVVLTDHDEADYGLLARRSSSSIPVTRSGPARSSGSSALAL